MLDNFDLSALPTEPQSVPQTAVAFGNDMNGMFDECAQEQSVAKFNDINTRPKKDCPQVEQSSLNHRKMTGASQFTLHANHLSLSSSIRSRRIRRQARRASNIGKKM